MKLALNSATALAKALLSTTALLALLLGSVGASAALIETDWADGNSNWNNAANWSPAVVPNNNATDQYVALIDNGSTVTLDITPTVNALAIDFFTTPASSLFINDGQALNIATGGTLFNGNVIGVNAPGTGVLVLGGATGTNINAGTLLASGGGTFEVNGAGGTIDNSSGTISALNGSSVHIFGFGTTISGGTIATAGTGVVQMSGFLVNLSGVTNTGTFAIPGTSMPASVLGITGTSTNAGTMGIFEPGVGVIEISNGITLNNTGTLQASGGGTLEVNGGTINNSSGTISALNGSSVHLFNTATVDGGTVATAGTGVVEVSPGFLANLNGVTNNGTFLIPDTATLQLTGTSTNTGTMGNFAPGIGVIAVFPGQTLNNTGTLQASGTGRLEINMGGSGTVNNTGTVQAIGSSTFEAFNGGALRNSGTFFVEGGSTFLLATGASGGGLPSITNLGTVNIAPGGIMDTGGATYVQTAGVTRVNGELSAGSALVDIRGGTLSGAGVVNSDVRNAGAVAPGNSPGILFVVGNYTQTVGGRLEIEIGGSTAGTQYDVLSMFGNASLDGTLDVALINGFDPTPGELFDILLTGSFAPGTVTGTFSTLDLQAPPDSFWEVEYLADRVRLEFEVPEPPASLVMLAAMGFFAILRRRWPFRARCRVS